MTRVKVTSQIFSHGTYIISTAKPSASMKKRFRKLMHSTETLVRGLLIYMIKCVSIPFLIMHFPSIWLLHMHAYY